jgi:glycosyltransferase involved in cell wall biosynthesis
MQPRKNITGLVEAFEQLLRKQRLKTKPQLVLAGKPGWLTEPILERIRQSPVAEQIIITGYVSEAEKLCLYRYATACCMVGWYEGFGIPALEAIRHGCLPIVANTSSLPEVVGQAGLLVNPRQPSEIADAMWRALRLKSKDKAQFRKHMRLQLRQFSWQKSAEVVLETVLRIAQAS